MKKLKNRAIKPYVFTGFFICLLLILGSFKTGVLKGSIAKKQSNFPIQSRVPNLTIVDTSINDDTVLVTLRNDSSKTITAYSASSDGPIYRNELLDTTSVILPGTMFTDGYGPPRSNHKGIFILAVVYEDGTTEGVPKFINQILDARAGKQAQLQRILPIFEDGLVDAKNATFKQKWQTNALKIQNLPNRETGKSFEYNAALEDEKNLALIKVQQFEQIEQQEGEAKAREELIYIKEDYERKNQTLRNLLKKQHRIN
jgi:hypothetical protein